MRHHRLVGKVEKESLDTRFVSHEGHDELLIGLLIVNPFRS